MSDELKDMRIVTMMSPSDLKAIDDWMFENRVRSRGEAIRRLCKIALIFDRDADQLAQQLFQLFLVTTDLGEKFADRQRQFLPTDELDLDTLTQVVVETMDRVSLVAADFEAVANTTLPFRSVPDMNDALQEAARAKVQASTLREDLLAGMGERPPSVLEDLKEPQSDDEKL